MGREAEVRNRGENMLMVCGTLLLEAHFHPCFSCGFECSASLVIKRIATISDAEAEERDLEKI